MRLLVIGDSVAIRVRPPSNSEKAYPLQLVREAEVINLARPGLTMAEAADMWFFDAVKYDPDVVLLHVGINDAVPRLIPRSIWRWFNFRIKHRFDATARMGRFVGKVLDRVGPACIRLLRLGGWTSLSAFEGSLRVLLQMIAKESQAKVLVFTIPPTTERVERSLPGSNASILRFNRVIERLAAEQGAKVLDLHAYVKQAGVNHVLPEGIHLSASLHTWVAQQVQAVISPEGV